MGKNSLALARNLLLAGYLVFPASSLLANETPAQQPVTNQAAVDFREAIKQHLRVLYKVTINGGASNHIEETDGYSLTCGIIDELTDKLMNEAFPDGNKWIQDVVPVIEFKKLEGRFQSEEAKKYHVILFDPELSTLLILDGKTRDENRQRIYDHLQEKTNMLLSTAVEQAKEQGYRFEKRPAAEAAKYTCTPS